MWTVSRTPLRISLFGGGTDYPAYYERHQGAVLGFAINKYIYISALRLMDSLDYNYRLSYSKVETVKDPAQFEHPAVRALLQHYQYNVPTDFSIQADLPASTGLGSSSTFSVGMINLLSVMQSIPRTKIELAREAIHLEQELLKENVGIQDQLHAAFGGINRFDFSGSELTIRPIQISGRELKLLSDWMMLVYTGMSRRATEIVSHQMERTKNQAIDKDLSQLLVMVDEGQRILEGRFSESSVIRLGQLLHESWLVKRGLSEKVSNSGIDDLYEQCRHFGAVGGKLCGAGGGGFLLVVVPPQRRKELAEGVGANRCIDFEIDTLGSSITHLGMQT